MKFLRFLKEVFIDKFSIDTNKQNGYNMVTI